MSFSTAMLFPKAGASCSRKCQKLSAIVIRKRELRTGKITDLAEQGELGRSGYLPETKSAVSYWIRLPVCSQCDVWGALLPVVRVRSDSLSLHCTLTYACPARACADGRIW